MTNLDDKNSIDKLDPKDLETSLVNFTEQCKQGWNETMELNLAEFKDIKQIDVYAMGGSRLGAVIMSTVFRDKLEVPFNFYAGYDIPGYVNDGTLAIIVSNSGNTEETLSSYKQAKLKTNKIIVITTGGKLGEMAKSDNFPTYFIDDAKLNPSSVPRVAVGFQIGAYAAIVNKLFDIDLNKDSFFSMLDEIHAGVEELSIVNKFDSNPAKLLAKGVQEKVPVVISSEHLFGAGNVINNQINESGKNFSCFFELPEANHHQLEGMQYPKSNQDNLIYLLIESDLYHDRVAKRYDILRKLLDELGIEHKSYKPKHSTKLGQALETVQFSGYFTYYLGLLNEVDPAPNPFVDKFKELLG